MQEQQRKSFLEQFLGALGAKQIQWGETTERSISGTVVYDNRDPEEQQDFIWHVSENMVPSVGATSLLKKLSDSNLIDIDKISPDAVAVKLPRFDQEEIEQFFDELFNVEVRMLDDGEETDSFFLHT